MDATAHYRAMARYNRLMNARLYDAAAGLPDADRKRDLGAFFRSIHGTLNHLLLADRAWLGRFTGDRALGVSLGEDGRPIAITSLGQELYADFARLRAERERTDAAIVLWTDGLSAEALARPLAYKTFNGTPCEHPLWQALSHFFNHQTHHRGQATALLTRLGVDPGATDLIAFLRSGEIAL
ncbi:MAG: DinB family protein [Candidatus Methylomirabilis sp.]|nr:DinB family protein [Deltaproteobacteria bacterium]